MTKADLLMVPSVSVEEHAVSKRSALKGKRNSLKQQIIINKGSRKRCHETGVANCHVVLAKRSFLSVYQKQEDCSKHLAPTHYIYQIEKVINMCVTCTLELREWSCHLLGLFACTSENGHAICSDSSPAQADTRTDWFQGNYQGFMS